MVSHNVSQPRRQHNSHSSISFIFTPRALCSYRSEEEYEISVRRISVRIIGLLRIDRRPTDDRPTSHLAHIGENSNGRISARGRPIHFMFGSTVGFSGSADRMALIPF